MACLSILRFPDPRLRKVAKPVSLFDDALQKLAADMAETMYHAPGVGLAATQVDAQQRLIVIDVSEEKNALLVLLNPKIIEKNGEASGEEGCLSVPGIYEKVKRAQSVRVRYQDLSGAFHELEAEGLLSVCVQHEIDHLDGKVFVDHLSRLKQSRIAHKLEKQAHEEA